MAKDYTVIVTFSMKHAILAKFQSKVPKQERSNVVSKLMDGYADGKFKVD